MADDIEDIEALDLKEQLALWRQEHPKRNYVGSQKLRWLPARRAAGGTASGVPGAASGAPPSEPYFEEDVCAPFFSKVTPVGQGAVEALGGSYLTNPELFVYNKDSD